MALSLQDVLAMLTRRALVAVEDAPLNPLTFTGASPRYQGQRAPVPFDSPVASRLQMPLTAAGYATGAGTTGLDVDQRRVYLRRGPDWLA